MVFAIDAEEKIFEMLFMCRNSAVEIGEDFRQEEKMLIARA